MNGQPKLVDVDVDREAPAHECDRSWKLDSKTKDTGRKGLAAARAALKACDSPDVDLTKP